MNNSQKNNLNTLNFLMTPSMLLFVSSGTVELHLSGIIGTVSHPDTHKIRIIGFFFGNGLHWQFDVEENFYKPLF
jgi:hypothetical protein